ncbi:hypothetical protein [Sporosarcina cascadiensis]|uniref:hypothetical protein n=1 Tax=Sporosarcina cascadiensis TaxID=2660747 RepID=UPI00129BB442|nr:hypothetical protein [Sporosarcina cascadiensis]
MKCLESDSQSIFSESESHFLHAVPNYLQLLITHLHSFEVSTDESQLSNLETTLISSLALIEHIHAYYFHRKVLIGGKQFFLNGRNIQFVMQQFQQELWSCTFVHQKCKQHCEKILNQIQSYYDCDFVIFIKKAPSVKTAWISEKILDIRYVKGDR